MNTIAIIQARMGSSRLPGKVLFDIAGQPMLARVIERARRAKTIDNVVVATTTDPTDDPVAAFCAGHGYPCYRGSLYDVLDRYYQAARQFGAEVIVRLTADCPLIDPGVIDETIHAFFGRSETSDRHSANVDQEPSTFNLQLATAYDFAANRLPLPWGRTFPIGLDVEVCTFQALERAWREATLPHHREHVMPYLYEAALHSVQVRTPGGGITNAKPSPFRILLVNHVLDFGALRWTVDTVADLELVRQVYACFPGCDDFTWLDVLALFERQPALAQINTSVQHKTFTDVDQRHTP